MASGRGGWLEQQVWGDEQATQSLGCAYGSDILIIYGLGRLEHDVRGGIE